MNKQEKLNMQRKELAKMSNILAPLRRSVNQLESEIRIERMQKHIGKYYLYENSSSLDKWDLYVKPISVTSGCRIKVLMAQKAGYMTEIRIEESVGDHLFQKEITKEEFEKGFNAILKEVQEAKSK